MCSTPWRAITPEITGWDWHSTPENPSLTVHCQCDYTIWLYGDTRGGYVGGGILVWPRASGPRKLSGCLTRFVRGGLLKIDMKMRQTTHTDTTERAHLSGRWWVETVPGLATMACPRGNMQAAPTKPQGQD